MCKLTQTADSLQKLSEEELLGRRPEPEPTLAGESAPPALDWLPQTRKEDPLTASSLTSEIQHLIHLNRNKGTDSLTTALGPQSLIPDDKSTSDSSATDCLGPNPFSTKRLICQESSQKFGLINRKHFGKSVFHLVKQFDEEAETPNTSLADISHKIDSVLASQSCLIQNLLSQCHKSTKQMEDLASQVKVLS